MRAELETFQHCKERNKFFFLHWRLTGLLRNGVEWRRGIAEILEMDVKGWEFKRTADVKVSKKGLRGV